MTKQNNAKNVKKPPNFPWPPHPQGPGDNDPWFARMGQNIQVVAFGFHFFLSAYLVSHVQVLHLHYPLLLQRGIAVAAISTFAGWKEFWYDARNEHDPPQTFKLNLEDFLGYLCGSLFGLLG